MRFLRALAACIIALVPSSVLSQLYDLPELTVLLDKPTAGTLDRGSYSVGLRLFQKGGLLGDISVGVTDRLMLGVGYGGTNIIGEGKVDWHPDPGVLVKYRLFEETFGRPALSIGFSSQGFGPYNHLRSRYQVKSTGFFAAASWNFELLGNIGFHGGINRSLESEYDDDPNLYVGVDKSLNAEIALLAEYDFAINDNSDNSLGSKRGYLNAALRWIFAERLHIELDITNLLGNREDAPAAERQIKILYVEHF